MRYILIKPKNVSVTEYYLSIIKEAIVLNGHKVVTYNENVKIQKDDIFIATNLIDALKVIIKYPKNKYVFWQQGLEAEESYIRNKSLLRMNILNYVECIVLKKSSFIFFVSNEMKKYSENFHNLNLDYKSFIMPCFNVEIIKESFRSPGKYSVNSFAYVGSLAKWQCFNETIELYSKIENKIENCKLYIYTPSIEEAKKIVEEKDIKAYEIKFVSQEQLNKELAGIKYGFCLREDSIINRVATPTKISSYMSSGIIPIFKKSIKSFLDQSKDLKHKVLLEDLNDINKIIAFSNLDIDAQEVYLEYSNLFMKYYNRTKYVEDISNLTIFK